MRARLDIFLGMFLCVPVAGFADEPATPQKQAAPIEYVDAIRTDRYDVYKNGANDTYIYPVHRIAGQIFPPDESDLGGGSEIGWCSDEKYKCVSFDSIALAVPRAGLQANSVYVAAGTTLKVLKCYRGKGAACQVGLIEADCYYAGGCFTEPAKAPKGPGHWDRMYFLYNEDFGITSFGFTGFGFSMDQKRTDAEVELLAQTYILVGDTGLLLKE